MKRRATQNRVKALVTALFTLTALIVPLALPAQANHDDRQLEVVEEVTSDARGSATLTAHLCVYNSSTQECASSPDLLDEINIDFEVESGPGDISGVGNGAGATPNSPDYTCTVPAGQATCEVTINAVTTGTSLIRAWIDHDKDNNTVEADTAEGRLSNNVTDCSAPGDDEADCQTGAPTPGDGGSGPCTPPSLASAVPPGGEPDCTDVVEIRFTAGATAILNCEPETATNPSTGTGSSETYTCTATDSQGNPTSNIRVDGENMNGANDPDNANGGTPDYTCSGGSSCTIIVSSEGEAGGANICFWFDSDNDAEYKPTEPNNPEATQAEAHQDGQDCDQETQAEEDNDLTDVVTKTWAARNASSGGVDAEPETAVNNTGENHTITATVYDQFGSPFVSQTTVNFEFFQGSPSDADGNTPASPDKTCTTNNASTCSITYTSQTPGRDRVCVWTNAAPTMTGDNQTGTCDGESLNDADDEAGSSNTSGFDAPEPANDDVDVVEKIWQQAGVGSRLNCEPETDTNPVGSSHTITCTATDASGTRTSGTRVDVEATGANDPDDANSPTSPDFTCTTRADDPATPLSDELGTCTFTHGPNGGTGTTNTTGVTTYRAWIDADNNNGTVEADTAEGRDETSTPGSKAEADDTDVVEKSWVAAPASLQMTPESDSAPVGTCNPYTITVLNSSNQPVQGAVIDVEQRHALATNGTNNDEPTVTFCEPTSGPNPSDVDESRGDLNENPDNRGTAGGETEKSTDANGKLTIGIAVAEGNGSDGTGQVTITAFYETTDNDDPDSGEPQDTSTKTWTARTGNSIDCSPETSSPQVGAIQTISCVVTTSDGAQQSGKTVTFTTSGVGTIDDTSDETDQQGRASTDATSQQAGTQTVTGTISDSASCSEGTCSDSVTITWQGDTPTTQCNDGVDNDGDGDVDFPADDGCTSADDTTEDSDGGPEVEFGPCQGYREGSRTNLQTGGQVIVGTDGDDILDGTDGNDIICGLGGNDIISAGGGSDQVVGNAGEDTISGGAGKDTINGNQDDDTIDGKGGNDVIKGSKGDDTLRGNGGWDTIRGGGGNDTLQGGKGADILRGGGGNDTLKGFTGHDILNGGSGTDTCVPGPGRDKVRNCER